jgi:hypothetical protein
MSVRNEMPVQRCILQKVKAALTVKVSKPADAAVL